MLVCCLLSMNYIYIYIMCVCFHGFGGIQLCLACVQEFASTNPRAWKTAARKLITHVSAYTTPEQVTTDLSGIPIEAVPQFTCLECPAATARTFTNAKALATHRMRAHGHKKLSRSFVPPEGPLSKCCPACKKHFDTHAKVLDHLEYRAKRCRAEMEAGRLTPIDPV